MSVYIVLTTSWEATVIAGIYATEEEALDHAAQHGTLNTDEDWLEDGDGYVISIQAWEIGGDRVRTINARDLAALLRPSAASG